MHVSPTNEMRKIRSTQSFCRDLILSHDLGEKYVGLQEKVGAEGEEADGEAEVHDEKSAACVSHLNGTARQSNGVTLFIHYPSCQFVGI